MYADSCENIASTDNADYLCVEASNESITSDSVSMFDCITVCMYHCNIHTEQY